MTNNMEQQERIRLLLSMQEHPERYTDEQITQMLADDPQLAALMEQLALTKRAFVKQEADEEALPMDDLWEQFASEHEEALAALESRQEQAHPGRPLDGSSARPDIRRLRQQHDLAPERRGHADGLRKGKNGFVFPG